MVLDCTPAGNQMKEKYYRHLDGPRGFIAQGSEEGFGKPYARGVNDEALVAGDDRFLQVVSCNTHNISTLIKTLCDDGERGYMLDRGIFVCMRRANDVSQTGDFVAAPLGRQTRRPAVRHPPRSRRPSRLPDPGARPRISSPARSS